MGSKVKLLGSPTLSHVGGVSDLGGRPWSDCGIIGRVIP